MAVTILRKATELKYKQQAHLLWNPILTKREEPQHSDPKSKTQSTPTSQSILYYFSTSENVHQATGPQQHMQHTMLLLHSSILLTLAVLSCCATPLVTAQEILVGNTRADNIVKVTSTSSAGGGATGDMMVSEFFTGISDPDHIKLYEGSTYISSGATPETSAILIVDNSGVGGTTKTTVFAEGSGMFRPYGFDFYNGVLYVASFRSDQVLMYNATSGSFLGVFAAGNGTAEGLVNGPNHLTIREGTMYLTTQGSTVISGELVYSFSSQIVKYNISTGEGTVFASPDAIPGGRGFVSMLGCTVDCSEEGDICYLVTSDFAGGLRKYSLDGTLIYAAETTYTVGATTGGLSILDGEVYVPGFFNETTPGVVMRFALADGSPLPADGEEGAIFATDAALIRPIGILALPQESVAPSLPFTYELPNWWDAVQNANGSDNLKRCFKRQFPPTQGDACATRIKICYFGDQFCPAPINGPFPTTKCTCNGSKNAPGTWNCEAEVCPSV